MECVYQFRTRLGCQWESLPRSIYDWLHKKEGLDIQLLMWLDSDSDSEAGYGETPPDFEIF